MSAMKTTLIFTYCTMRGSDACRTLCGNKGY